MTLIDACNKLGYVSIVIDPNFDAPGRQIADFFEIVQPNDYERTKQVAIDYKVDGIATSQMENPLRMMAQLSADLGFIFNTPEAIENSLNKYLMKMAFVESDVPHAKGIRYASKAELINEGIKGLEFPLIIKPTDSHSSRGVYKVDSFNQLLQYVDETVSFSKSGSFLIEEFIDGPEYSIESVTYQGKTSIVQYTEKIVTPFPNVVELGHIQPAELTSYQKKEINEVVQAGIKALKLDNTVTHTEIKLSESGPIIIEIGPRMAGDFISSYLVKNSCGVDLDEATIKLSFGLKPDTKHCLNKYSYIKYLELEEGKTVQSVKNWRNVLKLPNVIFSYVNINEGDTISRITDSSKRPGFVIVSGDNKPAVIKEADTSLKMLKKEIVLKNSI